MRVYEVLCSSLFFLFLTRFLTVKPLDSFHLLEHIPEPLVFGLCNPIFLHVRDLFIPFSSLFTCAHSRMSWRLQSCLMWSVHVWPILLISVIFLSLHFLFLMFRDYLLPFSHKFPFYFHVYIFIPSYSSLFGRLTRWSHLAYSSRSPGFDFQYFCGIFSQVKNYSTYLWTIFLYSKSIFCPVQSSEDSPEIC